MERLITYFKPENYHLELFIDKHKGTARGRVTITGEPQSDHIKLHAKDLTIDRIKVDGAEVEWGRDNDEIDFGEGAERGNASSSAISPVATGEIDATRQRQLDIIIDYHFALNTNMMGCYLSSYEYDNHEEKLVSTQFESHYARECFPCVDEPEAKATFDLEITVPDLDDTVLANTPVKNVVENTTSKTVTFETTPRMSTYLLAFCIGKFQSKSTKSKHGVEVTTYCALNQDIDSVDYANEIAKDSLDFYDDAFGIPYPLKKLDQVAIPDFEAGAMENWGLVTYRESCLLSGKTASVDDREYVSTVISHELSHQWFGDLVTMKWWDDLWLNESFATLMEYICIDAIHPEYKILENFFIGECRAAMNRDALPGVQAVKQDVNDPAEIATLFDGAIVYAKGARLMFMLYRLLGADNFYKGLKDYFKAHQYSNTTGDDLWSALQPYADFDVKEFMDTWISQPGYPVVTDGDQMRFLLTSGYEEKNWPLPGESDTKNHQIEPITQATWPIPEVADDMSGHYLINLSAEEFTEKLKNFDNLSFEQRVRLLLDRSLLAKTSLVSTAAHLELLPYFRNQTENSLWSPISALIGDLKVFFPVSDPDFSDFRKYIYYIAEPQLKRLGVEKQKKEDENDTKLRPIILGLALFSENQAILDDLAALYDREMASDDHTAVLSRLAPETRYAVLYAKLRANEAEFWPILLENYQKTADPDLRDDLLSVLASAKNHNKELLDLLKQPKIVRPQDHLYLFAYLVRNYKTQSDAMHWLFDNWDYVEQMNGEKSVEDYPRILASVIRTQEKADEFHDFFSNHADKPVLKRSIKLAEAEIRARLRLLLEDNASVHAELQKISKNL